MKHIHNGYIFCSVEKPMKLFVFNIFIIIQFCNTTFNQEYLLFIYFFIDPFSSRVHK